jgi:hypothetical protein
MATIQIPISSDYGPAETAMSWEDVVKMDVIQSNVDACVYAMGIERGDQGSDLNVKAAVAKMSAPK